MGEPLQLPEMRAASARAALDVLRLTRAAGKLADLENAALMLSVLIGHAENKPLSASDLAEYVGLPRASVVRRMQGLVASGAVQAGRQGRRVVYWLTDPNSPEKLQAARKAARSVQVAAAVLGRQ